MGDLLKILLDFNAKILFKFGLAHRAFLQNLKLRRLSTRYDLENTFKNSI